MPGHDLGHRFPGPQGKDVAKFAARAEHELDLTLTEAQQLKQGRLGAPSVSTPLIRLLHTRVCKKSDANIAGHLRGAVYISPCLAATGGSERSCATLGWSMVSLGPELRFDRR